MKMTWQPLTVLMTISMALTAAATNVGVVDMERLIKLHPRTKADRAILSQYVEDFEAERREMLEDIRAKSEEFEALREAAEDVGLSEKAIAEKRTLAKAKVGEIREMEQSLRELAATRQKELTSQELRMRKRVVADIGEIVETVVARKKLDLVIDATGTSAGGYPPVIYYDDALDITDAVIGKMPKADED